MKNSVSIIFQILGVVVLLTTVFEKGTVWGFALGIGLIVAPYTAAAMFLSYILLIACFLGSALLGAYIGAQMGGKDSFMVFVGFIGGGVVGYKIVVSDFFDLLLNPARKMSELDE